jgi:hypothetical protein
MDILQQRGDTLLDYALNTSVLACCLFRVKRGNTHDAAIKRNSQALFSGFLVASHRFMTGNLLFRLSEQSTKKGMMDL